MTESTAIGQRVDSTRDRTVFLNQFLLCAVIILGLVLTLSFRTFDDLGLLISGGGIAFIATGAALVIPWNRLPLMAAAIIPAVDIAAIALLREGALSGGFAALWLFPAVWAAWAFGRIGTILAPVVIAIVYWALILTSPNPALTTSVVLLPVTFAAAATITYFMATRARGQRGLLEQQSVALRQAVGRARRQEDLLTGVLEAVDFGVIRIDSDGTQTVANEAHARLAAVTSETPGGAYTADGYGRLAPEQLPLVRAEAGDEFDGELVCFGAPGERRRALSVTAKRLRGHDGTPSGTLVVTRDVTQEALAIRARDDLVATVSHELRNPLTAIRGYLELALDDPALPDGARRSLEIAERNAERLFVLVTDILAVPTSAPTGIAITIEPESIDLVPAVQRAVESVFPDAEARGIAIAFDPHGEIPAFGDELRVRQILDNLLSNAVKYGREGGHVEVECRVDGEQALVEVRDDGPGISTEDLPHVFERFYRADAVRKTATHGYGLGLAISRQIARAQDGDLRVAARPGGGTVFTLVLPRESAEEAANGT